MSEKNTIIEESAYCWNTIGMGAQGNRSCPKLKDFIHCRNCDVFKSKAALLLEAPPPPGYLGEWAAFLSGEKEDNADMSGEALFVFRLEDECLAFPAAALKEVARPSKIHSIPGKSDNMLLGLVNIKGSLQICFSLKAFLGIGPGTDNENEERNLFGGRFIVLEKSGHLWVFPVDEVLDICRYNPGEALNTPLTLSNACASYTKSVFMFRDKSVGYLDDELIISALKRKLL